MAIEDDLLAADKQLYPTGRAWKMPEGGFIEGLHEALNVSQGQAYEDALTLLSGLLPDNPDFTADDATNWERVYGLIANPSLTLDERVAALIQRIGFPGSQPCRQHYLFIQGELQQAGFDVFIYENIFPDGHGGYMTKTPFQVSGDPGLLNIVRYGQRRYGQARYGQTYNNKVANSIDPLQDLPFDTGTGFEATFFIGGPTLGSFANVPAIREAEFRQLILRLKPVQDIAFLFINYI